jgi:amino acid permease
VVGASMNFTNSIIGAGCFGLGGAIGNSGGLISLISIISFGWMTKLSFDLTIALSISDETSSSTFESLGRRAFGQVGAAFVGISKFGFSFGCMVAYIVIVKENFAPAIRSLLGLTTDLSISEDNNSSNNDSSWILGDNTATFLLAATIILPLSSLRNVTPFEKFSLLKIGTVVLITFILFILWIFQTSLHSEGGGGNDKDHDEEQPSATATFCNHWLEIRPGFIRSVGTFILTYTANHTIHLVFLSLDSPLQTVKAMEQITLNAIVLSSILIIPIGMLPYITFWEDTSSNLFELYASSPLVDGARLMLSVVMMLTYPMPFFSCRELLVLWLPESWKKGKFGPTKVKNDQEDDVGDVNDTNEMHRQDQIIASTNTSTARSTGTSEEGREEEEKVAFLRVQAKTKTSTTGPPSIAEEQIPLIYHLTLTVMLWGVTLYLALAAPSLGDVLNLVGCATGTMISFVLPGLFAVKLQQKLTVTSFLLLGVGVPVGCLGTYFSLLQLIQHT